MNVIYEDSKNAKKKSKIVQQEVGFTTLILEILANRNDNPHPLCISFPFNVHQEYQKNIPQIVFYVIKDNLIST